MSAYPYSVDLALLIPFPESSPPSGGGEEAGSLVGASGGNTMRPAAASAFRLHVVEPSEQSPRFPAEASADDFAARRLNAVGSETEERRIGAPRFSSSELGE